MGYAIAILFLILLAVLLFLPALKGWRTQITGWLATVGLGVLPLFSQITEYLQSLDWRQYLLNDGDHKNLAVIAIPAVLGLLMIVLRFMTTGPVGTKQ